MIQREVVTWATQLKGLGLLAGPPGTGKTQTAAELIYALLRQSRDGGPVLVVSSSNAAVDVLLARVVQNRQRGESQATLVFGRLCSKTHSQLFRYSEVGEYDIASRVIRMYHQTCQSKELLEETGELADKECDETEVESFDEFFCLMDTNLKTKRWFHLQMQKELRQCHVIFTTNSLAGSQAMTDVSPRYVIMDESGATPEYETLVIAARNPSTMLLVGDYMQLPPVIKSQDVKNKIGESMMERLWRYTKTPRRQLIYQYRFDRQFEEYLNQYMYNEHSALLPIDSDPYQRRLVARLGFRVTLPVVVIDSSSALLHGGESHTVHDGYDNASEAQLVVDVVRRLTESSRIDGTVKPDSIGICTPYRRQAILIQYKLQKMMRRGSFKYSSITVATADSFQGSERDYMIVSTVRTSASNAEFVLSQLRLNVMVTRGKVLTVVVSNRAMFESDAMTRIMRNGKTSSYARFGGEAFRGLFKWAQDRGGVFNATDWATMFETNGPVLIPSEGVQPEPVDVIQSLNTIDGCQEQEVEMTSSPHIHCTCCRFVTETGENLGWELRLHETSVGNAPCPASTVGDRL